MTYFIRDYIHSRRRVAKRCASEGSMKKYEIVDIYLLREAIYLLDTLALSLLRNFATIPTYYLLWIAYTIYLIELFTYALEMRFILEAPLRMYIRK